MHPVLTKCTYRYYIQVQYVYVDGCLIYTGCPREIRTNFNGYNAVSVCWILLKFQHILKIQLTQTVSKYENNQTINLVKIDIFVKVPIFRVFSDVLCFYYPLKSTTTCLTASSFFVSRDQHLLSNYAKYLSDCLNRTPVIG